MWEKVFKAAKLGNKGLKMIGQARVSSQVLSIEMCGV